MGVSCAEHAGGAKKDAVVAIQPRRESSGPDRRVLVGALAVIVVAAAVIFLRPSGGDGGPEAAEGAWKPLPSAGLAARTDFAYVSTGTGMIVWGGAADRPLADGAAYDVPTSTWKPLPAAPLSPRRGHSAVWTGTSMIVFGGRGPADGCRQQLCTLNDGAAYDPATDRWTPIAPAPLAGRNGHTAVWFQDRMVVWGGAVEGGAAVADGASYDPATNTWSPLPAAPLEPRVSHRSVASAHRMLVWGGSSEAEEGGKYFADGAIYSPATNGWTPMAPYPQTTEPAARDSFSSVWTGTHMLVWGGTGRTESCRPCQHDDGAAYELSSDSWKLMTPSPLSARGNHRAIWTGKEMVVWGGFSTTELNDGAAYNPASDSWSQLPVSPVLGRQGQAMVKVGDNLIVWGGHGPHGEGETRNANHDDGAILSLR
jgi:N-acetylneuraminic acid mutarotase